MPHFTCILAETFYCGKQPKEETNSLCEKAEHLK